MGAPFFIKSIGLHKLQMLFYGLIGKLNLHGSIS